MRRFLRSRVRTGKPQLLAERFLSLAPPDTPRNSSHHTRFDIDSSWPLRLFSRAVRRLSLLLAHLAVIAALAVGTGAHWMVLQSVAWTGMLFDYSHGASLTEAVQKTFDGKHPCQLCRTIEGAEKQQKQQEAAQPVPPIKGVLAPVLVVASPTFVFTVWPPLVETADALSYSPPVPPPRAA